MYGFLEFNCLRLESVTNNMAVTCVDQDDNSSQLCIHKAEAMVQQPRDSETKNLKLFWVTVIILVQF